MVVAVAFCSLAAATAASVIGSVRLSAGASTTTTPWSSAVGTILLKGGCYHPRKLSKRLTLQAIESNLNESTIFQGNQGVFNMG